MATRERRHDRAVAHASRITTTVGAEIRLARRTAGLSLRAAAGSVGLDHAVLSRIERGRLPNVSVVLLNLACSAAGLEFGGRAFPHGDPVRDAAHLALLARLRARLPPSAAWRTEVPLEIPGDLRAVDAVARLDGEWLGFEAETRLSDVQAVERKVLLKKRDARLSRLILVVADTRANRSVLRLHRDHLRASFPLDSRPVLAALRAGRVPDADGIVVI